MPDPSRRDHPAHAPPRAGDRESELLNVIWADVDHGRLRSLAHYLDAFPDLPDLVRAEYEAIVKGEPDRTVRPSAVTDRVARDGGTDAVAAAGEIPKRVGRYRIDRLLDQGGMGRVYLAHDPDLGREVVLKTLRVHAALAPDSVARLEREARIGGRLDDIEGVCPVLDVISEDGLLFLVMPFIDGETLARRLRRAATQARAPDASSSDLTSAATRGAPESTSRPGSSIVRDLASTLKLLERVARIVHEAHEKGVVHRDLKPANVMIRPGEKPVVLDFGLAVTREGAEDLALTSEGDRLGTPRYMAPEQVRGDCKAIDRRTDVYALGVMLYELLTMLPPYRESRLEALYARILRGHPHAPRRVNPRIPRDLEAVCLKAMEVEPARRYATALDFAADLISVRELRPTVARPLSGVGRVGRIVRRHPLTTGALAVALVALVAASYFWSRQDRAHQEVDLARAFVRYADAFATETEPAAEDLRVLAASCPGALRDDILENPLARRTFDLLQRRILRGTERSAEAGHLVVASPRGLVVGVPAELVIRLADGATMPDEAELVVADAVTARRRRVPLGPFVARGGTRVFSARIPEGALPALGAEAVLWLAAPQGEHGGASLSPGVSLRIVDSDELARVLAALPRSGSAPVDAVLRAVALLRADYLDAAEAEIAGLRSERAPGLVGWHRRLAAELALRRGDVERFRTLRGELSGSSAGVDGGGERDD